MNNLKEWLDWAKSRHTREMDLSLERVKEVAFRLNLLKPQATIITVAGTNGKGSTVAGLEKIYTLAGYRVGAFTSPFLFRFNEQIRINGREVDDDLLCTAFHQLQQKSADVHLTLFEMTTLAAFIIFNASALDFWILEVGLGGRWDAVNVLDADIAVITSIGIDHVQWLGNTREAIAREKAGICRLSRPIVCGDLNPPSTLIQAAADLKAPLFCQNKSFGFKVHSESWDWWSLKNIYKNLPMPTLALENISTVLMVIELLGALFPISREVLYEGIKTLRLAGRIESDLNEIPTIYDVSHNPDAAVFLKNFLKKNSISGCNYAVFSMLSDKDIYQTLKVIHECIQAWYVAPLQHERGASISDLTRAFVEADIGRVLFFPTIRDAYNQGRHDAKVGDRMIVFGSFRTVAEVKAIN